MDDLLRTDFVDHMEKYHAGSTVAKLAAEVRRLREAIEKQAADAHLASLPEGCWGNGDD